jgi:hypothetical protein
MLSLDNLVAVKFNGKRFYKRKELDELMYGKESTRSNSSFIKFHELENHEHIKAYSLDGEWKIRTGKNNVQDKLFVIEEAARNILMYHDVRMKKKEVATKFRHEKIKSSAKHTPKSEGKKRDVMDDHETTLCDDEMDYVYDDDNEWIVDNDFDMDNDEITLRPNKEYIAPTASDKRRPPLDNSELKQCPPEIHLNDCDKFRDADGNPIKIRVLECVRLIVVIIWPLIFNKVTVSKKWNTLLPLRAANMNMVKTTNISCVERRG